MSSCAMQVTRTLPIILCLLAGWSCSAADSNPLAKVLELMDELKAKILKEGEVEAKAYDEYLQWCQSAVQDTGFAIETATKERGELEAKIVELSAEIDAGSSKIEDLAAAVATNDA